MSQDDAEIVVEIINPSETEVSFNYSTTFGTASTSDFTEQTNTSIRFNPDSNSSTTIMIPITSDDIDELDETFTVTFAELVGATFTGGVAPVVTVTIEDDDQAMFSISDSYRYEVENQTVDMLFTIRLSKESSRDTSVTWEASTESSGTNSATRGVDYAVENNSHTGIAEIPAGSTSTTISIPIADDTIEESSESFFCYTF